MQVTLQTVLLTFLASKSLENRGSENFKHLKTFSKKLYFMTAEAVQAEFSQVHKQKCISKCKKEAFNKVSFNVGNTVYGLTGVSLSTKFLVAEWGPPGCWE